jgi:tetratricopeptide (TPR) repeat protein
VTLNNRAERVLPFLVLAAIVAVTYGGALWNGYVWDDRYFLLDTAWLDSFGPAVRLAFSPLFQSESYLRPLPLLSLYIEGLVAGRNPTVSHVVNVLIHLGSTYLVYLLARDALRWEGRAARLSWPALLLAAFFAVHPALTEAVVWVSSRFDLMATFFVLLGLWCATRQGWRDWRVAVAVAACFLTAVLCKESAAVFPFLLGVLLLLRYSPKGGPVTLQPVLTRRWGRVLAAGVLAGLAYLVVRYVFLGGLGAGAAGPSPPGEQLLARIAASLPKYLQLTLLPFVGNAPQHTFTWTLESSLLDYVVPIAVSVACIGGSLLLLLKRQPAGWVLLAWLICYLPVLHLVPINIGNNSIQQRFMYLPTAALLAMLPYALARVPLSASARRVAPLLAGVFLLACLIVTRSIVPAWRTDLSLWTWAERMAPRSSLARENLIWAYLEQGLHDKVDEAADRLREDGIETTINALVNVGVSKYQRGDFDSAIYLYEYALERVGPDDAEKLPSLYVNVAVAYALVGRDDEARLMMTRAVAANPENHVAIGDLLAFCEGSRVDTSGVDELTLRRAESIKQHMLRVLGEHRKSPDRAGLCPEPEVLARALAGLEPGVTP